MNCQHYIKEKILLSYYHIVVCKWLLVVMFETKLSVK